MINIMHILLFLFISSTTTLWPCGKWVETYNEKTFAQELYFVPNKVTEKIPHFALTSKGKTQSNPTCSSLTTNELEAIVSALTDLDHTNDIKQKVARQFAPLTMNLNTSDMFRLITKIVHLGLSPLYPGLASIYASKLIAQKTFDLDYDHLRKFEHYLIPYDLIAFIELYLVHHIDQKCTCIVSDESNTAYHLDGTTERCKESQKSL